MDLDRRTLLQGATVLGATAAVSLAGGGRAEALSVRALRDPLSRDPILHAVRRLTYGPTPALLARVRATGVTAYVDEQLDPAALSDPAGNAIVGAFPVLAMSARQVRDTYGNDTWKAMYELQGATFARGVWSSRQLYEVVVELWTNHFNIYPNDQVTEACKIVDDRLVVRPNALGRFADLLRASARSPAMLHFLNNDESDKDNPNENYGRELLELHTVGVDAGYTEADVRNAALALTGCTIDEDALTFRYDASMHYVGPLRVLGWQHPNGSSSGGLAVVDSLLDYLAHHPATARHLARKICTRFLTDLPPDDVVQSVADAYLGSDTAIVPTLRVLLASPTFQAGYRNAKVRRPVEFFAAALRATGATYDTAQGTQGGYDLLWKLMEMGQVPMGWHDPNGYPDVAGAWLGTSGLLSRWNTALAVAGWWFDAVHGPDPVQLAGGTGRPATAGAIVDVLTTALCGQKVATAHRNALVQSLGVASATDPVEDWKLQWKGQRTVSLILSSPYFQVR